MKKIKDQNRDRIQIHQKIRIKMKYLMMMMEMMEMMERKRKKGRRLKNH